MISIEELDEDLSSFDDWMERYQYIIDLGKELDVLEDKERNETNLVDGCLSQVWLTCDGVDEKTGALKLRGGSDSVIIQGLVATLMIVYAGRNPTDILTFDLSAFFANHGLEEHLSPNRRNGFYAMIGRIKEYAQLNV